MHSRKWRRRRGARQTPPTVRRHVARGVARRVVNACAQSAPQIAPPCAFRAARAGGERGAPRCCVALVPSSRDRARRPPRGTMASHPCKRRCRRPAAICEGQKPAGVAQHVPLDRVHRPSPPQRALAAHAAGRPVGALRVRARPRLAARGPQEGPNSPVFGLQPLARRAAGRRRPPQVPHSPWSRRSAARGARVSLRHAWAPR